MFRCRRHGNSQRVGTKRLRYCKQDAGGVVSLFIAYLRKIADQIRDSTAPKFIMCAAVFTAVVLRSSRSPEGQPSGRT